MMQRPNNDVPKSSAKAENQPSRDHELSDVQDFGEAKYERAKDVKTSEEQKQLDTERDYGRKA